MCAQTSHKQTWIHEVRVEVPNECFETLEQGLSCFLQMAFQMYIENNMFVASELNNNLQFIFLLQRTNCSWRCC